MRNVLTKEIASRVLPRFLAKIEKKESGCWEWTGAKDRGGYGHIHVFRLSERRNKRHMMKAHVFAWATKDMQRIGAEEFICHKCDNPSCVNPEHLYRGNRETNVRDMVSRGRNYTGGGGRGERHYKANLSAKEIERLKALFRDGARQCELARKFRIDRKQVWNIVRGKTWLNLAQEPTVSPHTLKRTGVKESSVGVESIDPLSKP